jgi:hypothetical protein
MGGQRPLGFVLGIAFWGSPRNGGNFFKTSERLGA